MKLLVIIPAFNESKTIANTVLEVNAVLNTLEGYEASILVIDDASTDKTFEMARSTVADVIRLPVNLGIGGAVQVGYQYAKEKNYELAIQIDGDGQHDPNDIKTLLKELMTRNVDMVIGSRFVDGKKDYIPSMARSLGMVFSRSVLLWGTKKRVFDTTSGFRVVNRKLIELFSNEYPRMFAGVVPLVIVAKHSMTFYEVPANFRYRAHGVSSIKLMKSMFYPFQITLAIVGVLLRS